MPRAFALCIEITQLTRVLEVPQDGFEQGAFSGAVGADNSRQLATVNMDVNIFQDFGCTDGYTKILYLCTAQPGTAEALISLFFIVSHILPVFLYNRAIITPKLPSVLSGCLS